MTPYDLIDNRLRNEMIQGQMHGILRDLGRLAGGYHATGALTYDEMTRLESLAVSLSNNKEMGAQKWQSAVTKGMGAPVAWEKMHRQQAHSAFDWDDTIGKDAKSENDYKIVDDWLEVEPIPVPDSEQWNPAAEMTRYIATLFEPDEYVAYVSEAYDKDGKFVPSKGHFDRTAAQLLDGLKVCDGDVGAVIGDVSVAGAWIRFNPVDAKGVKDANVTALRHALVESDTVDIDRQVAIIRKLELPVSCLVHSGGKSVHAIVKIDADTIEEYRRRVTFLYQVCAKNDLEIDTQNRNPSRLSRLPGVMRGDKHQRLLNTHIGKASWDEWESWISDINDDLPEIETLSAKALSPENLPDKAPELIEGVLRMGHKMRIAGPSKAGKSFALIQLAIAIAEGEGWMGWQCRQGAVLYVNLELDRASCLHRIADVYKAKRLSPKNAYNLLVWNLRGRSMPMDKLTPKLIRRAKESNLTAVIIDPIYKVLTGDENSAEEMSAFCNQFDKLATDLGCAVIDCHHHSKGNQGQKASRDRASGSGVFARDPDALIDIVELEAEKPLGVLIAV